MAHKAHLTVPMYERLEITAPNSKNNKWKYIYAQFLIRLFQFLKVFAFKVQGNLLD